MNRYAVISPEFMYEESALPGCEYGPSYSTRDYVEVEAASKRQAKLRGMQKMLVECPGGWCQEKRGDEQNPFTGLHVEQIFEPVCNQCGWTGKEEELEWVELERVDEERCPRCGADDISFEALFKT